MASAAAVSRKSAASGDGELKFIPKKKQSTGSNWTEKLIGPGRARKPVESESLAPGLRAAKEKRFGKLKAAALAIGGKPLQVFSPLLIGAKQKSGKRC